MADPEYCEAELRAFMQRTGLFEGRPEEKRGLVRKLLNAGADEIDACHAVVAFLTRLAIAEGKYFTGWCIKQIVNQTGDQGHADVQELITDAVWQAEHATREGPNQTYKGKELALDDPDRGPMTMPDGERVSRDVYYKALASRICYHMIDLGKSAEWCAEREGITAPEVRHFFKAYAPPNGKTYGHPYVRMRDRAAWLRWDCWKDGKKPYPMDERCVVKAQPDLEKVVGKTDGDTPVEDLDLEGIYE